MTLKTKPGWLKSSMIIQNKIHERIDLRRIQAEVKLQLIKKKADHQMNHSKSCTSLGLPTINTKE